MDDKESSIVAYIENAQRKDVSAIEDARTADRILKTNNIPFEEHYSRRIRTSDYEYFDYILTMDDGNIEDIQALIGIDTKHKIHRLLDYTKNPRNIKDPWYTGNFKECYEDIIEGCEAFLDFLNFNNIHFFTH